jgi:crotonobetainyl-CoA:carnitine CoA-transferase CaiB-like acyl-CoA transferase
VAAFDLIAPDMGGIMHVTGEPDGPPTSVGLPICDLGTGMWAVQGILAALCERWHTGKGRLVECSLPGLRSALAGGPRAVARRPRGADPPGLAPSPERMQTKDGYLMGSRRRGDLGALCQGLGVPAMVR